MASLTTDQLDVLEQKPVSQSLSTEELDAMESRSVMDPLAAGERAGQIWDASQQSNIPLNEAERVFGVTDSPAQDKPDGITKRFAKQFYNTAVAGVVKAVGTKSQAAQGATLATASTLAYDDFRRRIDAGEPVTDAEVNFYTKPYKPGTIGSIFGMKRDEWEVQTRQKYDAGELNIMPMRSPQEEVQQFVGELKQAQQIRGQASDISANVPEPAGVGDKLIDAAAGIAGFITQIAILKKAAPSMSEPAVWEAVNIANGGKPGHGAAMQLTLGGIGKAIPGPGFVPALERGAITSGIFGTTTYLGGGDTVDILVSMGVPFAFEGMGITKQAWAKYANKEAFMDVIKQKAPALKGRSNLEIDMAISDLVSDSATIVAKELIGKEQMGKEFAPKPAGPDISAEMRNYLQQKRYSELLERANAGDKRAIKELNDYVQGVNIPTYEELLNRGYNGDAKAFAQIQEGAYQGGPSAKAELKAPKEKPAGVAYKPRTRIDVIKEREFIAKNDINPPEKVDASNIQKARERGFITSIKEVVPELRIEGQYIPRATDPLAIKARNLVMDNLAKAEQVALKGTTDASVAVTAELIKYYSEQAAKAPTQAAKDALYEKAAFIGNEKAHQLTEGGRFIQAASIMGRYTPEGQLRFAAREIQKYNEKVAAKKGGVGGLQKKIPELTAEQAQHIMTEMQEIAKIPEGKTKHIRFQKLQNYVSELVPTPLYKKIITTWKAGLLTGIKTSGLNIASNAAHLELETMKDIPASGVDKIVSYFTGKRAVTPSIKGLRRGAIEGAGKGLEYLKSGYSERDIGTKLDYEKVNFGKGTLGRALQAYTDGIFRVLGAEDQPFYYAAKLRSFYEQAKVSAMNLGLKGKQAQAHIDALIENPTEKMIKYATKDAETAVFINNTTLGDIARGIQRLPGGEIVVPFGRTPSAVAMQVVNYSPVGIVKTIIENIGKGRFDQRAFSQGIGRGITGTAVIVMGAKGYEAGLITLDRPNNEKERKLWELEGRQPNSIKIGNDWRTIQSLGPAGNLLVIGGHFKRAFEETGSPTEAMTEALTGSAKSFTEQTFLRGVNNVVSALSDPERSATYVAGSTISSIVPTIVADTARATDTQERRAETIGEKVLTRIPGARQTLEPQVTVLGEEREPTANPIELMIDPTRPSKEISTPVIKELRRLWDEGWEVSPALAGDRKGFGVLSQQENTELWKRIGGITKAALEQLIGNELYPQLPDDKKADAITQIVNQSQTVAKTEMVAQKLTGLEGKELTDMIFELRKSGLATQEIIPVALSKRNPRKARQQ